MNTVVSVILLLLAYIGGYVLGRLGAKEICIKGAGLEVHAGTVKEVMVIMAVLQNSVPAPAKGSDPVANHVN